MKEIVLRKNVRFSNAKIEYNASDGFSTKSTTARRAMILLWTILICAGCMVLTTLAFFTSNVDRSNCLKTAVFEASTVIKNSQNAAVPADSGTTPQSWSLDSGKTYTLEVKPGTSDKQASTGFVLMYVSYTNDSQVLINKTYYTPAIKKNEGGFTVRLKTCCNVSVSFEQSWGTYSGGGISLDCEEVILGASDALVSLVPNPQSTAADNVSDQPENESPSDPPLVCTAAFSCNEAEEEPVMAAAVNQTPEETVQSDSGSSDTEMIVVDGELWLQPKDSTVTANVSGTEIKVKTAQMQMSDGTNRHNGAFSAYFPVLDQVVSILDYADGGQGEAVLYDGSTTAMPAGLSVADVTVILPKAPIINYYDAENTFAKAEVINGTLVYVSPEISTYCDAYAVNVTYRYQDNAGSIYYYMVQYQADAQIMAGETLLSAGTELQITEAEAEKLAEAAAKLAADEAAKSTTEKKAEETVRNTENTESTSVDQQTGDGTDPSVVDSTVESGTDSTTGETDKSADEEAAAGDSGQSTESASADQQTGVNTDSPVADSTGETPGTLEKESSDEAAPDVVSKIAEKLSLTRKVESLRKGDLIQGWSCSSSAMTEQAVAISAKRQTNAQLNQFILTFEDGRQLAVNGHMVFYDVTEQQYVELNGNNWDTFAGRTLMALDADGQMTHLGVTAIAVQQVSADCYNVVMDDSGIFANGVLVCDPDILK